MQSVLVKYVLPISLGGLVGVAVYATYIQRNAPPKVTKVEFFSEEDAQQWNEKVRRQNPLASLQQNKGGGGG